VILEKNCFRHCFRKSCIV